MFPKGSPLRFFPFVWPRVGLFASILTATLLSTALALPAHATGITYMYTGNPFASCSGNYAIPGTNTCNATYFVSGSFTLDQALAPNLNGVFLPGGVGQTYSGYALLAFQYMDNGPIVLTGGSGAGLGALEVWTNNLGQIDYWAINSFADYSAPSGICSMQFCGIDTVNVPTNIGSGYCEDGPGGTQICTYDDSSYSDPASGTITNDAGIWTMSGTVQTPEPGTLLLLSSGLVLLMKSRKRVT